MNNKNYKSVSEQDFTEFFQDWYDMISPDHFWMQWRINALSRQLHDLEIDLSHSHILDIGCGNSLTRKQLEALYPCVVDGTELDPKALNIANETKGELLFYDIHQKHEAYKEKYDHIALFDILEHKENDTTFLQDCSYHLKKGGYCIINVPSLRHLWSAYDDIAGHVIRYEKPNLSGTMKDAGLEIIDIRYWGLSLVPICWFRKFLPLVSANDTELIKKGFEPPSNFVDNLLNTLRKIETKTIKNPPLGTSILAIGKKVHES